MADPWEAFTRTLWQGAEILATDRALSEVMAEVPGPVPIGLDMQRELNETMAELMRARPGGRARCAPTWCSTTSRW